MFRSDSRRGSLVVIASSLAAFLPFLAYRAFFHELYPISDDWDMLDGFDRASMARWLVEPFLNEGLFPLFKLFWISALQLSGGSYFGMLAILWITHALILYLFGMLLVRFQLRPTAIALALLSSGLAWTNVETLAWFMQWNAQLAIVFFLLAFHVSLGEIRWRRALGICVLLTAADLCSSRGLVYGIVLAAFLWMRSECKQRARLASLCAAPSVVLTVAMRLFLPHPALDLRAAAVYGVHYLLLNPLSMAVPLGRWASDGWALAVYGGVKLLVYALGIRNASAPVQPLIRTLAVLDVTAAIALGVARWNTEIGTATSSRYQYLSLMFFGVAAGLLVERLPRLIGITAVLVCVCGLVVPWKRHMEECASRGISLREAIERDHSGDHFDATKVTAGRARQLTRTYRLH